MNRAEKYSVSCRPPMISRFLRRKRTRQLSRGGVRWQKRLAPVCRRRERKAKRFRLPEVGEVGEVLVGALDVEVARDLLERAEDLQLVRVHAAVARPEAVVVEDLLEAREGPVQDGDGALDDGAVLELVYVARVHGGVALALLGAGTLAEDALAVDGLQDQGRG